MSEQKNLLAGSVIALGATITEAMDDAPGFVPCGTPAQVILNAINTYAGSDDAAAAQTAQQVSGFVGHVSEHRGVTAHETADVEQLSDQQKELAQKVLDLAKAATADTMDPRQTEWLYRALGALEPGATTAAELLAQA
ncbi:MAG: hypothetical protein PUD09_02805 [Coriobacteriales bacterium]|nr:hypothetical protein [Coriobacteriales bacterium]